LLKAKGADDEDKLAIDQATDFLNECLTPYPRKSMDVFREATQNGISRATLLRAKKAMRIVASRHGEEGKRGGGVWLWALPQEPPTLTVGVDAD
jgi:hypothetical protein